MYEFALQSSENDDFGLVQRDDDFFPWFYRGRKNQKNQVMKIQLHQPMRKNKVL